MRRKKVESTPGDRHEFRPLILLADDEFEGINPVALKKWEKVGKKTRARIEMLSWAAQGNEIELSFSFYRRQKFSPL